MISGDFLMTGVGGDGGVSLGTSFSVEADVGIKSGTCGGGGVRGVDGGIIFEVVTLTVIDVEVVEGLSIFITDLSSTLVACLLGPASILELGGVFGGGEVGVASSQASIY